MDSLRNSRRGRRRPIMIVVILGVLIAGGLGVYQTRTAIGRPNPGDRNDPNSVSAGAKQGEQLFGKVGCLGCHTVNGKGGHVGPNLSNIANAGHSRQWLKTQIRNPKSHDPQTAMPAFNNLSDRDVNDLVDYLETLSTAETKTSSSSAKQTSASSSAAVSRGRELFAKVGCIGCHKIDGKGGNIGPDLSDVAAEGYSRDWFKTQIRHPREHDIHSVMPSFDYLSSKDVNDLVDYLETLKPTSSTTSSSSKTQPSTSLSKEAKEGKKVFDKVGCLGCHTVHGKGGNVGPNLSNEGTKGYSRQWLKTQIRDPKSHDPQTVMPAWSSLSDQQVSDLVAYLERLGTTSKASTSTSLSGAAKKGKQLFDKIGCLGCHTVHGQGGDVGPNLSNEAAKGRSPEWLTTQIRNPRAHDPQTAMPAWDNLTPQQVKELVAYLESLGAGQKQGGETQSSPPGSTPFGSSEAGEKPGHM